MAKLNSPFPWVGGKRILRDDIISRIPNHTTYIEAFAGGAWVYWGKQPSEVEVINDINGDLINLYKHIQNHREEFYDRLWWILNARSEFYRIVDLIINKPGELSDLDRAVYYFYLLKHCFGGKMGGKPSFGFSRLQPPKSAITHETLVTLSERLSNTYIENLSFERLIKNYDYEEAFFYCDPPYVGSDGTTDYTHVMSEEKHRQLRDLLANIKGKFLLSYDDAPVVKELYKGFKIEKTKPVHYSLKATNGKYKQELLIRNY